MAKLKKACNDKANAKDACHDKATAILAMAKPSRLAATKPIEACNDNDKAKVKLAMNQPRNAACGKASSLFLHAVSHGCNAHWHCFFKCNRTCQGINVLTLFLLLLCTKGHSKSVAGTKECSPAPSQTVDPCTSSSMSN